MFILDIRNGRLTKEITSSCAFFVVFLLMFSFGQNIEIKIKFKDPTCHSLRHGSRLGHFYENTLALQNN